MLCCPHIYNRVELGRALECQEVLLYHRHWQVPAGRHLPEEAIRLPGKRQGGNLRASACRILRERAPTTADVENVITWLQPDRIVRQLELASNGIFERLVAVTVRSLRVAAMPSVQEGEKEIRVAIIVYGDRLLVAPGIRERPGGDST